MLLQMAKYHSFLMTEWCSIVCICVCVCVYIHTSYSIHSAVDGNTDCCHALAIVNNVAVNIEVCLSFGICLFGVFSDMYQGKELLGHMVVLLLVLWEISILFSTVTAPVHLLNNQCTRIALTSSPTFMICALFDDSHSDRWEVIPHCGLDLFLWWLVMLSIFPCACQPSAFPLWKNVCSVLHFLIRLLVSLRLSCMSCLYMLNVNLLPDLVLS